MGSNTSKINHAGTLEGSNKQDENPDPRSPTPEIVRTPLHDNPSAKHNITKNVDLRKTFDTPISDEKMVYNNPIFSAVIKNHLQLYDPRSPTQEFERTPIVIQCKTNKDLKAKSNLQNENSLISPCLVNDENEEIIISETKNNIITSSKKLCMELNYLTLDDSEIADHNNQSLPVDVLYKADKLLETNFDCTDCDNDHFEDSINNTFDLDKKDEAIPKFEILDDDPRSPTMDLERTPIVVAAKEEENIEDMSDDKLIKVLQNANAELRYSSKSQNSSDEIIIYEDTDNILNKTPKQSQLSSNARTPLSCMKNKGDSSLMKKTLAFTQKDSKSTKNLPSNLPKKASQIPRLKSLSKHIKPTNNESSLSNISKKSAISRDCENTPPQTYRDKWDKDGSVVF